MMVLEFEELMTYCFLSLILGILIGWSHGGRKKYKNDYDTVSGWYKNAVEMFEKQEYLGSLLLLTRCDEIRSSHEIDHLRAMCAEKLERFDFASTFYDCATSPSQKCKSNYQTYYYYRSARAYYKQGDFEFSFIRTNDAIKYISDGTIPRFIDKWDFEDELRVLRLISTMKHFKGTEALNKAKIDIEWILNNEKSNYHQLASSYKNLNDLIPNLAKQLELSLENNVDLFISSLYGTSLN